MKVAVKMLGLVLVEALSLQELPFLRKVQEENLALDNKARLFQRSQ